MDVPIGGIHIIFHHQVSFGDEVPGDLVSAEIVTFLNKFWVFVLH